MRTTLPNKICKKMNDLGNNSVRDPSSLWCMDIPILLIDRPINRFTNQSINEFTNRHPPTNPNPPTEQKKLETLNYELALRSSLNTLYHAGAK